MPYKFFYLYHYFFYFQSQQKKKLSMINNSNIITMKKQSENDSDSNVQIPSSDSPLSDKLNLSAEFFSIDDNQQQINEQNISTVNEQLQYTHQEAYDKQYFAKELLKCLGYEKKLKTLEKEDKNIKEEKNPEEQSNQKKIINQKKNIFCQNQFKELIQNSANYETMVQALEAIENDHYQLKYEHVAPNSHGKPFRQDFQKRMKGPFSFKQQATVPMFKNLEIVLQRKQVVFIDVNAEQKLCLLDSEDYLHIISLKGETKPIKIEDAKEIIYLKWINKNVIFSINIYGKVTVYWHQGNEVKVKQTIPLKMPKIKRINVLILKYPQRPDKEYVRILIKNQNREFLACQIVVHTNSVKFTGGTLFETNFSFKSFNILQVPKIKMSQNEEENNALTDIEHYYGLTENGRNIIKFDTIVKKQGIIWTSNKKIDSMASSKCKYFLIMFVIDSKERKQKISNQRQRKKIKFETVFQYEFVKMNGHGCIIQRVPLDLQNPLLPISLRNPSTINLSRMKLMEPQWLACFDWRDSIIYISVKTGKILHIEEIEQNVKVIGVGPSNCIVCSGDEKIFIMSVNYTDKRKVTIESRPTVVRDRQSLILRLTRNGIPQTLLQLLQELRNNQIQLIQT